MDLRIFHHRSEQVLLTVLSIVDWVQLRTLAAPLPDLSLRSSPRSPHPRLPPGRGGAGRGDDLVPRSKKGQPWFEQLRGPSLSQVPIELRGSFRLLKTLSHLSPLGGSLVASQPSSPRIAHVCQTRPAPGAVLEKERWRNSLGSAPGNRHMFFSFFFFSVAPRHVRALARSLL